MLFNEYHKCNILIAGGAGFIGANLCQKLINSDNYIICVDNLHTGHRDNIQSLLNNNRFEFIEADICANLDIKKKINQIYNLACPASPLQYQSNPIHTMMTNVQGTANLLHLAKLHNATYLQASTSEVYGDPTVTPQSEDYWGNVNCTGPRACYDEGKRAAEALCFDSIRELQVDARVARIFNTYGPGMRPSDGRVISNLIVQAMRNEPLTVYGNGTQTRSFCYVSDLIDALIRLMNIKQNPNLPINIGNPLELTIQKTAELISTLYPTYSKIVYKTLPIDDPQQRRPDITRAKHILGWEPKVNLSDGILETIKWFEQILSLPKIIR